MRNRNRRRVAAYICFVLSALFISVLLFDANGPHQFWWNLHRGWHESFGDGGLKIILLLAVGSAAFAIALTVYERFGGSARWAMRRGRSHTALQRSSAKRTPIAVAVSVGYYLLANGAMQFLIGGTGDSPGLLSGAFFAITDFLQPALGEWGTFAIVCCFWTVPTFFPALWIFHMLTERTRRRTLELHCRKCDYILRGLSEPRCPECGEAI